MNEQSNRSGQGLSELQHQIAVIKWTQQPEIRSKYPELKLLYHIPNERKCSEQQGVLLKKSGVKKGVPDLCLPVARGQHHGLYVELKKPDGETTMEQRWWIEQINAQGYFAVDCYGWQDAVRTLEWYLGLGTVTRQPDSRDGGGATADIMDGMSGTAAGVTHEMHEL